MPGAEGSPELAEGHCPCEDQAALYLPLGAWEPCSIPGSCRRRPGGGQAWEGFWRTGLYVGSLSREAVTVTNTGLSPGLGGSLSDSVEKVHGSEALRGLSQTVDGPVTVPGPFQAPLELVRRHLRGTAPKAVGGVTEGLCGFAAALAGGCCRCRVL